MTDEQNYKAKSLIKKYLNGDCTEVEKAWVENWYLNLNKKPADLTDKEALADLDELEHRLSEITHRKVQLTPYLRVAAIALICLAIGVLWNKEIVDDRTHNETTILTKDILPGSNRAQLSLDGRQSIALSEQQVSLITNNQSITYSDGKTISAIKDAQMATVSTPLAGQYQVILPDGTHVWLNANSSITYPTRFDQHNRTVSISGEVYLDVAKNPDKPFVVNTNGQQIEVLGTSFNVNAYGDSGQILTTLAEGSLRVTNLKYKSIAMLKPGQQAVVTAIESIEVKRVDVEEASSWISGLYIINDEPLEKYAKQIERWYDVQVDMRPYENTRLSAIIPRNARLSEVLQAIELKTGVKFEIRGRRVMAIE